MRSAVVVLFVVVLSAGCRCGHPRGGDDAGPDDAAVDAGGDDASVADASIDAGLDAGVLDSSVDAGLEDAGLEDAGTDAGAFDAGVDAGGSEDAGGLDSGVEADAGADLDAGDDGGHVLVDAGNDGCWLPSGVGAPFRVRAVAANLSSGNLQSYDPGHGQRILQGLEPDIVMIQEFNFGANSVADFDRFTSTTFDGGFAWVRGDTAQQIPNGIISRWPILASGDWVDPRVSNRGFTWAKVDLPGPRDLWVVSVHLLTANANERNLEANALLARLDAGVPIGDFLVIGGDFNTDTRSEAALSTLSVMASSPAPYPADQQGVEGTNASRAKPYDQVLASRCLSVLEVPVDINGAQYDAGLVVDTRVYTPIADLAPALTTDSAAPSMQHMAVVRDFVVAP